MKGNIPGIYNYCDRWCERCKYTSRCAVFADSVNDTEEEKDISNQAYWNKISKNLKKGLKILHKAAKQHGVDLDNISREEEEQIEKRQREISLAVNDHPLTKLCDQYSRRASSLIEDKDFWKQHGNNLIAEINGGIINEQNIQNQLRQITDCREIIGWYLHFIGVKFQRALSSSMEDDDIIDPVQNDMNGSARVALVALQHTREAWIKLFELIPDEDRIFPVLALLSRIDKHAHVEFPMAEQFVRPGFDSH